MVKAVTVGRNVYHPDFRAWRTVAPVFVVVVEIFMMSAIAVLQATERERLGSGPASLRLIDKKCFPRKKTNGVYLARNPKQTIKA